VIFDEDGGGHRVVASMDNPVWAVVGDLMQSEHIAGADCNRNLAVFDTGGDLVAWRESELPWPQQNSISLVLAGDDVWMAHGNADREVHIARWNTSADQEDAAADDGGDAEFFDETIAITTAAVMSLQLSVIEGQLWCAVGSADGQLDAFRLGAGAMAFSRKSTSVFLDPRLPEIRMFALAGNSWIAFRQGGSTLRLIPLSTESDAEDCDGGAAESDAAEIDTGVVGSVLDMVLVGGRSWVLIGSGNAIIFWDSAGGVRLTIDCGGSVSRVFWSGNRVFVQGSRGYFGLMVRWAASLDPD
jgi:hypothetical protein